MPFSKMYADKSRFAVTYINVDESVQRENKSEKKKKTPSTKNRKYDKNKLNDRLNKEKKKNRRLQSDKTKLKKLSAA